MSKPVITARGRLLLRKALAAIKRYPRSFNMRVFMDHDDAVKGQRPYCGTTACLAGHLMLAAGFPPISGGYYYREDLPKRVRRVLAKPDTFVSVRDLAARLVVGRDESRQESMGNALFYGHERTHEQISATVRNWLTGRLVDIA